MLTLDGFYVTDAVVPPEGIELRRTLIKWADIKQVDFVDWNFKVGSNSYAKAVLTSATGATREVFLWEPGNGDDYSRLSDDLLIIGKLMIGGAVQDVQMKPTGLKRLAFGLP